MRTIEATVLISPDGHLTIEVPTDIAAPDIPPGTHRAVVVIEEQPAPAEESHRPKRQIRWEDFPVADVGPWPENLSLRREDMYDDWGR